MRHIDDGDALGPEATQDVEEASGLALAERRRRFVEDEDGRCAGQRLGDLHQLPLGERE